MTIYEPWTEARAKAVIARAAKREGATLVCLQALQAAFGYVPQAALPLVADALNLSRAEVYGVMSFYHDLRETPPGRHVLKLCRAEACQSVGADALGTQAQDQLGISWGETTPDGRITLEAVYCLGLCACAPSAMFDQKPVGGLDRERLAGLIEKAAPP